MKLRKFPILSQLVLAAVVVTGLAVTMSCGDEDASSSPKSVGGATGTGGAVGGASAQGAAAGAGGDGAVSGAKADGALAGAGGDGAGGVPSFGGVCLEVCTADDDCQIDGMDLEVRCNADTQRCETEPTCDEDTDCLPFGSLWFEACEADADCPSELGAMTCIEFEGAGLCATLASEPECDFLPEVLSVSRLEDGEPVEVCADTSYTCYAGNCRIPCQPGECGPEFNGSACNEESGFCECVSDEDCIGPGVSRCNTQTGACECASDLDCQALGNADACVDGVCGCTSVSACEERLFDGTTSICE